MEIELSEDAISMVAVKPIVFFCVTRSMSERDIIGHILLYRKFVHESKPSGSKLVTKRVSPDRAVTVYFFLCPDVSNAATLKITSYHIKKITYLLIVVLIGLLYAQNLTSSSINFKKCKNDRNYFIAHMSFQKIIAVVKGGKATNIAGGRTPRDNHRLMQLKNSTRMF